MPRYQFAWLELYEEMWCLLTDILGESINESRKWSDEDIAISELIDEGWTICGSNPNWLSKKLKLPEKYRGYGLMRTIH